MHVRRNVGLKKKKGNRMFYFFFIFFIKVKRNRFLFIKKILETFKVMNAFHFYVQLRNRNLKSSGILRTAENLDEKLSSGNGEVRLEIVRKIRYVNRSSGHLQTTLGWVSFGGMRRISRACYRCSV